MQLSWGGVGLLSFLVSDMTGLETRRFEKQAHFLAPPPPNPSPPVARRV